MRKFLQFPPVFFGTSTRALLLSDLSGLLISVGDRFPRCGSPATAYASPLQESSSGASSTLLWLISCLWCLGCYRRAWWQGSVLWNPSQWHDPLLWPCIAMPLPWCAPVIWPGEVLAWVSAVTRFTFTFPNSASWQAASVFLSSYIFFCKFWSASCLLLRFPNSAPLWGPWWCGPSSGAQQKRKDSFTSRGLTQISFMRLSVKTFFYK